MRAVCKKLEEKTVLAINTSSLDSNNVVSQGDKKNGSEEEEAESTSPESFVEPHHSEIDLYIDMFVNDFLERERER